jgi:hypothetical protein
VKVSASGFAASARCFANDFLQKVPFVKSLLSCCPVHQWVGGMQKRSAKRRNVKSGVARDALRDDASTNDGAADRHERGKDYLSEGEIGRCSVPPGLGATARAITCSCS